MPLAVGLRGATRSPDPPQSWCPFPRPGGASLRMAWRRSVVCRFDGGTHDRTMAAIWRESCFVAARRACGGSVEPARAVAKGNALRWVFRKSITSLEGAWSWPWFSRQPRAVGRARVRGALARAMLAPTWNTKANPSKARRRASRPKHRSRRHQSIPRARSRGGSRRTRESRPRLPNQPLQPDILLLIRRAAQATPRPNGLHASANSQQTRPSAVRRRCS
jgi:hypothetical protein